MGIAMLLNWDAFRWCWGAASPASSTSPSPHDGVHPKPVVSLPYLLSYSSYPPCWKPGTALHSCLCTVPEEQGGHARNKASAHHSPNANPCSPAVRNMVQPLGLLSFTGSPTNWPGCGIRLSWRSTSSCPSRRAICQYGILCLANQAGRCNYSPTRTMIQCHGRKNEVFRFCMCHKPEILKESPAPSHPGISNGTKTHYKQPGISWLSVLYKCPYSHPGPPCIPTPKSLSGRLQHLLNFAQPQLCSRL